jgi:hypothetical protein
VQAFLEHALSELLAALPVHFFRDDINQGRGGRNFAQFGVCCALCNRPAFDALPVGFVKLGPCEQFAACTARAEIQIGQAPCAQALALIVYADDAVASVALLQVLGV